MPSDPLPRLNIKPLQSHEVVRQAEGYRNQSRKPSHYQEYLLSAATRSSIDKELLLQLLVWLFDIRVLLIPLMLVF